MLHAELDRPNGLISIVDDLGSTTSIVENWSEKSDQRMATVGQSPNLVGCKLTTRVFNTKEENQVATRDKVFPYRFCKADGFKACGTLNAFCVRAVLVEYTSRGLVQAPSPLARMSRKLRE